MSENIKILLVDDEMDILEVTGLYLEMEGHHISKASGGNQALSILKAQNFNFDLVISDVRMPEGDGIFLLEEIKKNNTEKPPVLLVSGFLEISKEECLEKGALDLLGKPFEMAAIKKIISSL